MDQSLHHFIKRVIRPEVQAIHAYATASDTDGYIKLDAMECPYVLPDELRSAIANEVAQLDLNRYPSPQATEVKSLMYEAFSIPSKANIVLGNGSDELIHLLIQATCNDGDVVLAPSPSFVMYEMSAMFNHARFVSVPLDAQFELDVPAMLEAIRLHQPKIVFLAMPNNPTGNAWDPESIQTIIEACPGLVVIDEAYQPFFDVTWMPKVLDFPNVLVMRTVSKIGLAGIRFGYLAGHESWTAELEKVRPPYNVSVLTQAVIKVMIEHKAVLDQQAAQVRKDREPLHEALLELPGLMVYPSSANFLLVRSDRASHIVTELKHRKILVRGFGDHHPVLKNCLRISIGTATENAALIAALYDILERE